MTNRQVLLSVIDQLPDQQIVKLLAFAQNLSPTDLENSHAELSQEQLADLRSRLRLLPEKNLPFLPHYSPTLD